MRFVLEPKIPLDVWRELKTYIIHDIKNHGKHLKKTTEIINYNTVMRQLPRIYAMTGNPKIVYKNHNNISYRCKKFLYCRKSPSTIKNKINDLYRYSLIIEYGQVFPVNIGTYRLKTYFDKIDRINCIKDFS